MSTAVRPHHRAAWLLTAAVACNSPAADLPSDASTSTTTATTTTTPSDTTASPTSTTSGDTTTTATTSPLDPVTTTETSDPTTSTTSTGESTDTTTTSESSTTTASESSTSTTAESTTTGTTSTDDSTTAPPPTELGELSGDCGLIDAMELNSPAPFVFTGAIDFGDVGYDYDLLTPGGKAIYEAGNLNPGSLYSEIVAYEVLARCDGAELLKTENTIVYDDPMGKKTDLLVDMDGLKVGVSVVRAVGFPKDAAWTPTQAKTILEKKLSDILVSSDNVAPEDAWVKQILGVVAYGPMHLESLLTAYDTLDPALKADTVLVITVTDGDDAFIY